MKRTVAIGATIFMSIGLAACGSSSSTPSNSPTAPLTLAQACPKVDSTLTADFPDNTAEPTAAQLAKAQSDLAAISATASPEAQTLINSLSTSLQALAADPSTISKQDSSQFTAFVSAATAFKNACDKAGAPLKSGSASASPTSS